MRLINEVGSFCFLHFAYFFFFVKIDLYVKKAMVMTTTSSTRGFKVSYYHWIYLLVFRFFIFVLFYFYVILHMAFR